MTNRSTMGMADGPPHKRRRTHQQRKSPKSSPHDSVPTSADLLQTTPATARREKKPAAGSRKKEGVEPVRVGGKRDDGVADRCSDYLADEWRPNFQSTYPLSKALERRRVLVDYIHLVKRISARKDQIEIPQKRPSVLQPQTIEDLEKEIDKCSQELNMLTHKRDENLEVKKTLMAKYKALYREEDEERKKLQQQQEEQKAKTSAELERFLTLVTSGLLPPEMLQQLTTSSTSNNAQANLINSIIQSAQPSLLSSSSASSLDLLAQINQLNAAAAAQQTAAKQTPAPNTTLQESRAQPTPAQKHQISTVATTTTPNRTPASITQQHPSLLNPSNSPAASLNLFHNMASTQNPFSLTSQPTAGLLTQQSQGGLVSTQPQSIHSTGVRDQASTINAQHLLQSSAQQQQNRASPNVQTANLLQQQPNPFLSSSPALASVQQQSRPQSAFPTAQTQSQLDLQNMLNQWSSSQNFASLGGMNNPQTAALLAAFQQQQQLTSNLTAQQALQQNLMARAQQQQKSLLSAGLLNAASRQSPLTSSSYSASQPQQQQAQQSQMTRKTGAVSLSSQQQPTQQSQMQSRLQLPAHQAANLTGRSATPQFAVPNLPTATQSKIPPRAQSTRPPMNFGAQSVITSTTGNPTSAINLTAQQQSFQSMFQPNLDTTTGASTSSSASANPLQQNVNIPDAMLQQLASLGGMDQNSLIMLLLAQQNQAAAQQQLPK